MGKIPIVENLMQYIFSWIHMGKIKIFTAIAIQTLDFKYLIDSQYKLSNDFSSGDA